MGFSFNNLPITTLVGAEKRIFDRVTTEFGVDNGFRGKYLLTKACQRVLSPLYKINKQEFCEIEKPQIVSPVFIIGHWRSGTTFVHNMLSCDSQFGYCTPYQTVFPHLMFCGRSVFENIASLCMPASRPTDGLELSVAQPQEEEFAVANITHASFYHFWLFPQNFAELANRYLFFDTATKNEEEEFCRAVVETIQTALYSQNKTRFLSKNPPHTARVKLLHRLFPDAKFIYIMRNPYSVIESSCNFFCKTLSSISLQSFSKQEIMQNILKNYQTMYSRYTEERKVVAPSNLVQIKFEDFEAEPVAQTEKIYNSLNLGNFDDVRDNMIQYAESKKSFRKKCYNYSPYTIHCVNKYCKEAIEEWEYPKL